MGFFGKKNAIITNTDSEFSFNDGLFKIQGDYLVISKTSNYFRVPISAIETVRIQADFPDHEISTVALIGCGVKLCSFPVTVDVENELQDWLLKIVNSTRNI